MRNFAPEIGERDLRVLNSASIIEDGTPEKTEVRHKDDQVAVHGELAVVLPQETNTFDEKSGEHRVRDRHIPPPLLDEVVLEKIRRLPL